MKLFSLLILSGLLAYPVMAQEVQASSATVSASETNSEARSLYEAGDAAFDKDQFEDAFALFRKSADLGYAPAEYMLAQCYASGRGVKEDRSKAAELWTKALAPVRKAAEAGDAYAMYLVGDYILKKSRGLNSSMPWIEDNDYGKWFQMAADKGYLKADFRLADIRSSSASSAMAVSMYLDVKGYRRAADAGYAPAQYVMGGLYETGKGVEKDPVEALNWYRKAAEGGWPRAMYRIGVYCAEGKVVDKDDAEAAKWYRMAADAGYPQAQYMFGRCLEKGEGVEKDVVEAVKWYRKAAEQDLPAARSMLASCYANGRGVGYDIREAAKWNIEPWHVGSSDRNYHMYVGKRATSHLDPAEYEDYDNGLDAGMIYYAADMTDDPRASDAAPKQQLGDSYFYGRNGLEQNYAEAAKWYRKATEAVVGRGFYELGFCYEYGKGVEADLEEAEKWYRKAEDARQEQFNVENRTRIRQLVREARNGNAESAYQAGLAFASGTGVKQDMPEALKWFRAAAEGNHSGAQYRLGRCYAEGTGVEKNAVEAVQWYRKAAGQGNAGAQFELGKCCETGNGVKTDAAEAADWYRQAAEQGSAEAQNALADLYRKSRGEGNEFNARLWSIQAAEQGNAEEQYRVALRYSAADRQERGERLKWLLKSADQGYAPAQYQIAYDFSYGGNQGFDRGRAADYLIRAAHQDYAPAQKFLADCYREPDSFVRRNDAEAVRWYLRALENKTANADFLCYLGECYAAGKGVRQNKSEAVKWYRKAVEYGRTDTRAQYLLGDCCYLGDGMKQDKAEAAEWYRKAAEKEPNAYNYKANLMLAICYLESGDEQYEEQAAKAVKALTLAEEKGDDRVNVLLALATCHEKGIGVEVDRTKSFRHCSEAAEKNFSPDACMRLARCYRLGIGVEKNREKEEEWLLKAALKGSPETRVMLGDFYAERKEDPVSCANALRWYQAAAEHGYAPARDILSRCYREGLLGVKRNPDAAFDWETGSGFRSVRDALREFEFAD